VPPLSTPNTTKTQKQEQRFPPRTTGQRIGAHRRPEAVVLSCERYLTTLSGRERVKAILADRRASGPGMSEEEAMLVAVQEQHASRR
jgi:hypothetical protein